MTTSYDATLSLAGSTVALAESRIIRGTEGEYFSMKLSTKLSMCIKDLLALIIRQLKIDKQLNSEQILHLSCSFLVIKGNFAEKYSYEFVLPREGVVYRPPIRKDDSA